MNPLIPSPDPLGVPTPPSVFVFFSIVTLVIHFIFMNYVLGGTLILAVNEWLFGKDRAVTHANHLMLKVMPFSLSMAVTMGVAPLLFVQVLYGQFFYSSNIMMGGWWLLILALVAIGFYMIYILLAKRPANYESTTLTKSGLLINAIAFLGVAFLLTNNATLVDNPRYWQDIYNGTRSFIAPDRSLWARYLHNVISALAVAGLWMAIIGRYQLRYYPHHKEMADGLIRRGLMWTAGATTVNILVGFGYLFTLSDRMADFMGNGPFFVGWSVSVITGFLALVLSAMALMKPDKPNLIWGAVSSMAVTLLGMAMGRELIRIVSLKDHYGWDELVVRPSYSSFALFLVTFVIGLGVLGYLVKLVWSLPLAEPDGTGRK